MAAHVKVDFSEFNDFMDKVRRAGKENEFQKELAVFMEGIEDGTKPYRKEWWTVLKRECRNE